MRYCKSLRMESLMGDAFRLNKGFVALWITVPELDIMDILQQEGRFDLSLHVFEERGKRRRVG